MSIDTIDVILEEADHEGVRYESILLILNGEAVKGNFDGYLFALSGDKRIETYELRTCGCGVAGCAGIFYGTEVKRRRYSVEWRDIDSGLPKRFYNFDRASYDAAVAKTMRLMREIAEKREARGASDEDENEAYDGVYGFWTVEDFESRVAWTKRWRSEW